MAGSDYIYPRESNRVMRDLLECKGGEIVGEHYVSLHADDRVLRKLMKEIQKAEADVVFSTVIGRTAQQLYGMYADAGIDRDKRPIRALLWRKARLASSARNAAPVMCCRRPISPRWIPTRTAGSCGR